jgi:hypothetical protein
MNKKPFFVLILMLILTGCIKETYNMKKLSDSNKFSPAFLVSAASGDITFSDIVKPGDTIKFDNDKFVRVIFRKDSVINFQLKDYYDLSNMVSFKKGYKLGDVAIGDFKDSIQIPLSSFSGSIAPPPVNGTYIFPPFGPINLGNKSFNAFPNFQNAVFSSGTLTISVKNNLPAPLNSINITLYNNTVPPTPISGVLTIPAIAVGATQSATLDLTGKTLTNSITAGIVLTGSPGTAPNPVTVNLNSTFQVKISTTALKVQSGRIVLPAQSPASLSGADVVSFNPGANVEIADLKILTGRISYTVGSSININGSFTFTLPTALQGTIPISKTVTINGTTPKSDTVSLTGATIDLSTVVSQPFNKIPLNYSASVSSNGSLIDFNKNDSIYINFNMLNPNIDYVRGDFGQLSKQVDPDNLDTGFDQVINNITGLFHISDPSIKLKYSNSFGIPIGVTLNAVGKKNAQTVNLGLAPFTITYPTTLAIRDKKDSLIINKNNSLLPDLVSLPPSVITFSGSAKMNPAGPVPGRNNYVFGNSRFLVNLEVEVPLQLWMKNLQFADTVDNFLKLKSTDSSKVKPTDFDSLRLNIVAENGFPMGVSVKLMLYDSVQKVVIKTIDATSVLLPAPVDANGKSNGKTESSTIIRFDKDFFDAASSANKMIFIFTLNTSGNGTTDVKIYSDYSLSFKASAMAKPNIKL